MSVSLSRRLLTTKEFRENIEAGVFQEDDRLELIDGEIENVAYRESACSLSPEAKP